MPENAEGMVKIKLTDGNAGTHGIVGPISKRYYGYRQDGDVFYVLPVDVDNMVAAQMCQRLEEGQGQGQGQAQVGTQTKAGLAAAAEVEEAATAEDSGTELRRVQRLGPKYEGLLIAGGITTIADLAAADADTVAVLLDTHRGTAERLIENARRMQP